MFAELIELVVGIFCVACFIVLALIERKFKVENMTRLKIICIVGIIFLGIGTFFIGFGLGQLILSW